MHTNSNISISLPTLSLSPLSAFSFLSSHFYCSPLLLLDFLSLPSCSTIPSSIVIAFWWIAYLLFGLVVLFSVHLFRSWGSYLSYFSFLFCGSFCFVLMDCVSLMLLSLLPGNNPTRSFRVNELLEGGVHNSSLGILSLLFFSLLLCSVCMCVFSPCCSHLGSSAVRLASSALQWAARRTQARTQRRPLRFATTTPRVEHALRILARWKHHSWRKM